MGSRARRKYVHDLGSYSGIQQEPHSANTMQKLLTCEVLLNNQADICTFHFMLVEDVKETNNKICIKGVGGVQLFVNKKGYSTDIFVVYGRPPNMLRFAKVENLYKITYNVQKQAFINSSYSQGNRSSIQPTSTRMEM
jgi:hypothetical protein